MLKKLTSYILILLLILLFGYPFWNYFSTQDIYAGIRQEVIEGIVIPNLEDIKKVNVSPIKRISPLYDSSSQLEKSISSLIYEPLFRIVSLGEVDHVLAEKEEFSEDKKTLTITLKKDLQFSNGDKLDANDVIATIAAIQSQNEKGATYELLEGAIIKYIDEYTLSIGFSTYTPAALENLSFGIMSSDELDKYGFRATSQIFKNPIGTGPFIISESNSTETILKKNSLYRKNIKLTAYKFIYFKDIESIENAINSGVINFTVEKVKNINTNIIERAYTQPDENKYLAIYFNLSSNLTGLIPQETLDLLNNKSFRQAVNLGVDREALIANLGSNNYTAMYRMYPENSIVTKSNTESTFNNNLEKANKKLDELGLVIGLDTNHRLKDNKEITLELTYLNSIERQKTVDLIIAQFGKMNLHLKGRPIEAKDMPGVLAAKDFQLLLYGIETNFDPDRTRLFDSSQISETGLNLSSYKSSETVQDPITKKEMAKSDLLLSQGRQNKEMEKRVSDYKRLENLIQEDSPVIFLYNPSFNINYNTLIKGISTEHARNVDDLYWEIQNWEIVQ